MHPGDAGFGEEPEERWGMLGADGELEREPTERGDYGRFYDGVAAALRGDGPPPVEPEDALAALEVLDAARSSAREGQTATF
jgi:predicted dehydrogenase